MPKEAYMQTLNPSNPSNYTLLLSPWNFYGKGGKPGDEYWILGA